MKCDTKTARDYRYIPPKDQKSDIDFYAKKRYENQQSQIFDLNQQSSGEKYNLEHEGNAGLLRESVDKFEKVHSDLIEQSPNQRSCFVTNSTFVELTSIE